LQKRKDVIEKEELIQEQVEQISNQNKSVGKANDLQDEMLMKDHEISNLKDAVKKPPANIKDELVFPNSDQSEEQREEIKSLKVTIMMMKEKATNEKPLRAELFEKMGTVSESSKCNMENWLKVYKCLNRGD
jgi:hypothetical protein